MSEKRFLRPCAACGSGHEIVYETDSDDLTMRLENLPPLAKHLNAVVAAYRRIKGLGKGWQSEHGTRGLIYAGALLERVGVLGGQLERAVGLMEWCKSTNKDWSLDTAGAFFDQWRAAKAAAEIRNLCDVCGEQFSGLGKLCPRHTCF